MNGVNNDRAENEGGATDTHSEVNVRKVGKEGKKGKEKPTGTVGGNIPTKSQSDQSSQGIGPVGLTLPQIPVVGQNILTQSTHALSNTTGPSIADVSTSQFGSAGHQNTCTTMSSEHTNRMQNRGGVQSSGDHACMCLVLFHTPYFHLLYICMYNIILCSL